MNPKFRTLRRQNAIRVDDECPVMLDDYMQQIAGQLYLVVSEFEGENYVHSRKFFENAEGYLKPKMEGCSFSLERFAIFLDILPHLESRFWCYEEGLPNQPYEGNVGPWKVTVDIFANIRIWKFYYDAASDKMRPSKKGITFPLQFFRVISKEIYNLSERFPSVKSIQPCFKSTHSLSPNVEFAVHQTTSTGHQMTMNLRYQA